MIENEVQETTVEREPEAIVDEIMAKDTMTAGDYNEMLRMLHTSKDGTEQIFIIKGDLEEANPAPSGGTAMKIGAAQVICNEFDAAAKTLANATDNADRQYFLGLIHMAVRDHHLAAEAFGNAIAKGMTGDEIGVLHTEALAMNGELEAAADASKAVNSETPEGRYVVGLLAELNGDYDTAIEAYDDACDMDYSRAMFRMAYFLDLHGNDEEAIELYEQCLTCPPVYANALLNLAVLYEDAGRDDDALEVLQQLLQTNPRHKRARLYMRDVCSSKEMFYDEDKAKRIAKRNAVLDIPVTDFELSVRARNCLKKMNIITLGDLVSTSEAELLGYKNFGETSLREIKEMLTAKGLRLGQALEEANEYNARGTYTSFSMGDSMAENIEVEGDEAVLSLTLDSLEFSVRARRVLEQIGARTLGDLASRSEVELMSQKNFGQTSLNEMRSKLSEYGLKFRD